MFGYLMLIMFIIKILAEHGSKSAPVGYKYDQSRKYVGPFQALVGGAF